MYISEKQKYRIFNHIASQNTQKMLNEIGFLRQITKKILKINYFYKKVDFL
jgi:hypothetical protein